MTVHLDVSLKTHNSVLLFTLSLTPANFLPFGDGDTRNPMSDDGSSQAISLQQPFTYFQRTYTQIYVPISVFFCLFLILTF